MNSSTLNIILPTPFGFALAVTAGTMMGMLKGLSNHEIVDLSSGARNTLRSFIVSVTISSIAFAAFAGFTLVSMNMGLIGTSLITSGCIITYMLKGINVSELMDKYEQIINISLNRLIFNPNGS